MSLQGTSILLKLLSGPNAGAEMELAPGDWVLGSDEDSQLLLLDAGVRPQHLLLHISGAGTLTVTPKGGSAVINGAPLPAGGMDVPFFTVFTVGGVHICCGPTGEAWPDLATPSLLARTEQGKATEPATEQAGVEKPARVRVSATDTNKVDTAPSAHPAPSTKVGGRRPGRIVALGLLALLLGFLVLDVSYLGFFFSDAAHDAASLARSLRRRGYTKVTVQARQDGSIQVQGVVDSNVRMDSLVAYIESLPNRPGLSVVSAEDLALALQARFKRADAALRVSRAGTVLRLTGYVYDMLALEQLLLPEREGLASIPMRVDVITWNAAENELRTLIGARGLEQKIRFIPGVYHVALQAQPLSAQERQALMVFMRQADDFFGTEGALFVERWNHVPPQPIRPPSPARVLYLAPTPPATAPAPVMPLPMPQRDSPLPVPQQNSTVAVSRQNSTTPAPQQNGTVKEARNSTIKAEAKEPDSGRSEPVPDLRTDEFSLIRPDPGITPVLPEIVMPQQLSCSSLRLAGEGHTMGVVLGGVVYRKGAKMPDGLQVKYISPDYVVLQRGKVFTRICTASEMAKE